MIVLMILCLRLKYDKFQFEVKWQKAMQLCKVIMAATKNFKWKLLTICACCTKNLLHFKKTFLDSFKIQLTRRYFIFRKGHSSASWFKCSCSRLSLSGGSLHLTSVLYYQTTVTANAIAMASSASASEKKAANNSCFHFLKLSH